MEIDGKDVKSFPSFHTVGKDIVTYIVENMKQWEEKHFYSLIVLYSLLQ